MRSWAARFIAKLKNVRIVIYLTFNAAMIIIGALIATLGSYGSAVGTSMVASGACGWIILGWVVYSEEEATRRKVIDSFGFVSAFSTRSIQIKQEYDTRLSVARSQIDVMGYGLNSLREDYSSRFAELASRATVRILLVDLDAPAAGVTFPDLRDFEEDNSQEKTGGEVRKFVEDTRTLWSDPTVDFHVRLAKTIPSVNMFRIDDEAFWGPYLVSSSRYGKASRNLPTLIVRQPGYMFDRLVDHFDAIWTNAAFSRDPQ